jgi:hypothetical protein
MVRASLENIRKWVIANSGIATTDDLKREFKLTRDQVFQLFDEHVLFIAPMKGKLVIFETSSQAGNMNQIRDRNLPDNIYKETEEDVKKE